MVNLDIMKKIIILLLIPIISFSQTFNELKMINSLDDFKKVMIENKYEFDEIDSDGMWLYGFNRMEVDSLGNKGSEKWGMFSKDGSWKIQFNKRNNFLYPLGDYDEIVENIKDECIYVGIEKFYENYDYVTYSCNESKFDGKIGFMISDGRGNIRYFPKKE
jgi:hypothetical protein